MISASKILYEVNTVHKLTDYILLNSCSTSSLGLYNGKAGMALALFEVAKSLQDEYIEEQASELLQESLLSKNDDIGFENGLSGIGYVLLYLIENNFVDANFEELFGDNLFKIINTIKDWKTKQLSTHIFTNIKVVYFLNEIARISADEEITSYVELFSITAEKMLIKEFKDENNTHFLNSSIKADVLKYFEDYLKVAYHCESFKPSLSVLRFYTLAYQNSKYTSNFFIGHYLHTLTQKIGGKEMETIAEINKKNGIKNMHPETMLLSQQLDLLYLLSSFYQDSYPEQVSLLEEKLYDPREKSIREKDLFMSIQPSNYIAGYQYGIARLLLYWAYSNNAKNPSNYTYFKKLL